MQKRKLPSMVTVLILTLITVVMWVSFEAYRLFNKTQPPSVPEEVSASLNPQLDVETMRLIESRLYFEDAQVPEVVISDNQSDTSQPPVPTPEASTSSGTPL